MKIITNLSELREAVDLPEYSFRLNIKELSSRENENYEFRLLKALSACGCTFGRNTAFLSLIIFVIFLSIELPLFLFESIYINALMYLLIGGTVGKLLGLIKAKIEKSIILSKIKIKVTHFNAGDDKSSLSWDE